MIWVSAILVAVATLGLLLYNRLLRDRRRVNMAWSDIDVQLQRRHDLVPRLVNAVGHYAGCEQTTLEAVTALRDAALNEVQVGPLGDIEERLGNGVKRLLSVAENNPDLKASEHFLALEKQLVDTENYLQFARRFYNISVRVLNTRIESLPHRLIATWFGIGKRDYFQKAADEVATVPLSEQVNIE